VIFVLESTLSLIVSRAASQVTRGLIPISSVAMRVQTIAAAAAAVLITCTMQLPPVFATFANDVGDLVGYDGFVFQGTPDNRLGEWIWIYVCILSQERLQL
jgi:hypothetical protein